LKPVMKWRVFLTALGVVLGSGVLCAGQQSSPPTGTKPTGTSHDDVATSPNYSSSLKKTDSANQPTPTGYRIGTEDELQISVWKEPDFSTSVVVRPDGMITLPLLNDLYVVGLQTTDLQALLTEKLKPFVNEPQVTVIVRSIRSRKVFVYGEVGRPGAYPIGGSKTVLEVLADAGGLSVFAKKGSIYVLRKANNKQSKLRFNYKSALKGTNPADNFELLPCDVVVVP
jgi:polysaccharide biosynthesis/export protein